jgi:two-component system nitrate/nitrite response regulator NarL
VLILDDELAGALEGEDLAGPTVVLSDDPNRLALRPQEAGFALLPADATPAQLRAAILAAVAGLVAVPLEAATTLLVEAAEGPAHPPPDEPLSPRETDVLRLLAEGWSNKRIARALAISDNTVKYHLAAVYGKLGVSSRAGAVRRGLEAGLLKV